MPLRSTLPLFALLMACAVAAEEAQIELGKRVFVAQAQPSCTLCHTLADAGASGAIGPNLDQLRPDAARIEAAVRNGVGVMPPFAGSLSDEQIRAVAAYVAKVTAP